MPVAASVSYNATTKTATLTPSAALANSKTYTISVTGGAQRRERPGRQCPGRHRHFVFHHRRRDGHDVQPVQQQRHAGA